MRRDAQSAVIERSSRLGTRAAIGRYSVLLLDAVRTRKADTLAVIGLGLVGALAQAGAIGALLSFLNVMSKSEPGGPVHWTWFDIERGMTGLIVVSAVLAGMLLIATGASYLSARRARAIGRACTERCVEKLIRVVAEMPTGANRGDLESPRTLAVRGSRLMGLSAESAIKLFHPLVQIVVLLGALMYIDFGATLWLVPAMLLPLPVLWKFNKSVRRSARLFYESAAAGFGRAAGSAIDTVDQTSVTNKTLCEAAISQYRASPAVADYFHAYDDMSLTADRAVLITSSFRPLVLGYVLVVLGSRALSGAMDWAQIIAFVVVLVQILGRAEGVIATFSVLNRLYTQVAAYMRFIERGAELSGAAVAKRAEFPIVVRCGGERVEIAPGAPVQVYSGHALSRLTAGEVFDALADASESGAQALRSTAFVGRRYRPRGDRYGALAAGEPGQDAWVCELAERLGCASEVRDALGRIIDDETWNGLGELARVLLQIGPILRSEAQLIAFDMALLTALERADADRVMDVLARRAVLIVAPDYRSGMPWAMGAIVIEDQRVVAAGSRDWWNRSALRERLTAGAKQGRSRRDDALDAETDLV